MTNREKKTPGDFILKEWLGTILNKPQKKMENGSEGVKDIPYIKRHVIKQHLWYWITPVIKATSSLFYYMRLDLMEHDDK